MNIALVNTTDLRLTNYPGFILKRMHQWFCYMTLSLFFRVLYKVFIIFTNLPKSDVTYTLKRDYFDNCF